MAIGVSVFALVCFRGPKANGWSEEVSRARKITLRMFRAPEPPPSWFPGPGKSSFKGCGGPERRVLNVLIGHTKHPIF